jgi:type II secretory pathway pseudopilin PulG
MRSSRSRTNCNVPSVRRSGFTLVEILVVVLIIILLTAATLPAILPALNSRRVSEGSRLLQSELARQRDLAVRSNAPRGFRLIPDPIDPSRPNILTCSRLVAIEPAPDYSEGLVYRGQASDEFGTFRGPTPGPLPGPFQTQAGPVFLNQAVPQTTFLRIIEKKRDQISPGVFVPNEPTSWYWNIRQGDKIRLSDSGKQYTIVGPVLITGLFNPERYINNGMPDSTGYPTGPGSPNEEFLFVLNGEDDDKDGFIDEACDGIDNDADGIIDPGFNGFDDNGDGNIDELAEMYLHKNADGSFSYPGFTFPYPAGVGSGNVSLLNEFEYERFTGKLPASEGGVSYTIVRRPVPVEGARDIPLPTNVVIDLTTWNAGLNGLNGVPERSRLPVDLFTGFVDVMIAPNGQVLVTGASSNASPPVAHPYYHFWLTELDDVFEPHTVGPPFGYAAQLAAVTAANPYRLPMTRDATNDPRIATAANNSQPVLKGERRLLSVNTRTGSISSTAIETFYLNNPSYPFEAAESGVKDAQP